MEGDTEEDEDDDPYLQPKHGIQIHLTSSLRLPTNPGRESSEGSSAAFFAITHVREYSDLPLVLLPDSTDGMLPRHRETDTTDRSRDGKTGKKGRMGGEGATVRVVAGELECVKSPPPLTNFVSAPHLLP